HLAELSNRIAAVGREARIGREEANAVVAPVVDHAALEQEPIGDVVVDWQQLDRGDAQSLQVGQRRGRSEPAVRAAQVGRYLGMSDREALDVDLVDQRAL